MRLIGMLPVVAAATVALHWYRPFEATCAALVFAAFVLVLALMHRNRTTEALPDDPDSLSDDDLLDNNSTARTLGAGALTGVLWLVVTAAVMSGLSRTPVYGWFVDEQGDALATELDVLARNRAWTEILARLDRAAPPHLSPDAQARINRDRYLGLANLAAALPDPAARCAAERSAESFAETHAIDPSGRLPVICQPTVAVSHASPGARIRILTNSVDPAGRTVLSVSVTDQLDAPILGLNQNSFTAFDNSREVPIAEVTYAPSVSPPKLFLLTVASSARTVGPIRGLLTGLVRDRDRIESVDCGAHCDLAAALLNAANRLSSRPGAMILLINGEKFLPPEAAQPLLPKLRRGMIPLHILLVGRGPAASQWEDFATRTGGSFRKPNLADLTGLRRSLAASILGEGTYVLRLEGRHNKAEVGLR